jgi:GH24 family phage-related lysozyme (muramidase)
MRHTWLLVLAAVFCCLGTNVTGNATSEHADRPIISAVSLIAPFENPLLWRGKIDKSWPHYPGNYSHATDCSARGCWNGCTITFGYNMGAQSPREIRRDLRAIGVDEKRIQTLTYFASKRGAEAYKYCGGGKLGWESLTREEGLRLLEQQVLKSRNNVLRRMKSEGVTLNEEQIAVLVALDFQSPAISSKARELWTLIRNENWRGVAHEIRTNSGTQHLAALQHRRDVEADAFLTASGAQENLLMAFLHRK